MKFKTALEIAQDCGLETVGEALYNIKLHAANVFDYNEIQTEYDELCDDYKELSKKYGFSLETKIDDIVR
jgi:hypothetical protein